MQLDAEGRATVAIVPSEAQSLLRLRDEEGHVAEEPLEALAVPTGRPLVVADRRVARVGEVLRLRMRGTVGPLVLQVGRDETVLCSRAFPGQDEETVFDLPLDADLAGVLEIGVFRRTEEGLQGTLTRVLVVRDRALDVRAVAVEDAYRPAETAEVDVEIRDREGQPSAAVLGYWGVDEALLALAPWPDGREDVFDLSGLEGESRAGLAAAVERGAESSFLVARKALGAITTHAVTEGEPRSPRGRLWDLAIRHRQAPAREGAARKRTEELSGARCEAAHAAWLSAYARLPLEAIRSASSLRESLAFVLDRGVLDEGVLVDPWGTPLEIGHGVAEVESRVDYATRGWSSWTHWGIPVTSAGPDLVFGTEDDGRFAWRQPGSLEIPGRLGRFLAFFEAELGARRAAERERRRALAESLGDAGIGSMPFLGPAHNGLIGLGGGAGGAFRGRGGYRDLGAGGGGRAGQHEVPGAPPPGLRSDALLRPRGDRRPGGHGAPSHSAEGLDHDLATAARGVGGRRGDGHRRGHDPRGPTPARRALGRDAPDGRRRPRAAGRRPQRDRGGAGHARGRLDARRPGRRRRHGPRDVGRSTRNRRGRVPPAGHGPRRGARARGRATRASIETPWNA